MKSTGEVLRPVIVGHKVGADARYAFEISEKYGERAQSLVVLQQNGASGDPQVGGSFF